MRREEITMEIVDLVGTQLAKGENKIMKGTAEGENRS